MDSITTIPPDNLLQTALEAVRLQNPILKTDGERQKAILPKDFQLIDTTDPERLPKHVSAAVTVDDRASLEGYANRFSNDRSIIIADYDTGTIAARLDWHHDNEHDLTAQPASHSVTLSLRDSEEYGRWSEMENKLHRQEEFAYFIEENVSDVASPEAGALLEVCRDLEATQGVTFKSGINLGSGDRSFTYQDETNVKNELVVPTEIMLSIPLYRGEAPTSIRAKFRFRVRPDGLLLGFNWHRVEYQRQATFNQMAVAASENTGLPVFFGRVSG